MRDAIDTRSKALQKRLKEPLDVAVERDGEDGTAPQAYRNYKFDDRLGEVTRAIAAIELGDDFNDSYKKAQQSLTKIEKDVDDWLDTHELKFDEEWANAYMAIKKKEANAAAQLDKQKGRASNQVYFDRLTMYNLIGQNIVSKAAGLVSADAAEKARALNEQEIDKSELEKQIGELKRLISLGTEIQKANSFDVYTGSKNKPQLIDPGQIKNMGAFMDYYKRVANKLSKVVAPGEKLDIQTPEDKIELSAQERDALQKIIDEFDKLKASDPLLKEQEDNFRQNFTKLYNAIVAILDKANGNNLTRKDISDLAKLNLGEIDMSNVKDIASLVSVYNSAATKLKSKSDEFRQTPEYKVDKLIDDTDKALKKMRDMFGRMPEPADDKFKGSVETFAGLIPQLKEGSPREIRIVYDEIEKAVGELSKRMNDAKNQTDNLSGQQKLEKYFEILYPDQTVVAGSLDDLMATWKTNFNRLIKKNELKRIITKKPPAKGSTADQKATSSGVDDAAASTVPGEEELENLEERTARSLVKTIREHIRKRNG